MSNNPNRILPGKKPHPAYRASRPHLHLLNLPRRLFRALAKLVRA